MKFVDSSKKDAPDLYLTIVLSAYLIPSSICYVLIACLSLSRRLCYFSSDNFYS